MTSLVWSWDEIVPKWSIKNRMIHFIKLSAFSKKNTKILKNQGKFGRLLDSILDCPFDVGREVVDSTQTQR